MRQITPGRRAPSRIAVFAAPFLFAMPSGVCSLRDVAAEGGKARSLPRPLRKPMETGRTTGAEQLPHATLQKVPHARHIIADGDEVKAGAFAMYEASRCRPMKECRLFSELLHRRPRGWPSDGVQPARLRSGKLGCVRVGRRPGYHLTGVFRPRHAGFREDSAAPSRRLTVWPGRRRTVRRSQMSC